MRRALTTALESAPPLPWGAALPGGVDGQPTTYVVVEAGESSTATFRNLQAVD